MSTSGDPRAAVPGHPAEPAPCPVALSTASVYPGSTATAFELAAQLGYDGVEVMVGLDSVSQDVDALDALAKHYEIPILAIHAPCLFWTQRVWSPDPWERLDRSLQAALDLGARTVVVHPPFRWQRDYARRFVHGIAELGTRSDVQIAVENMYPWRAAGREMPAYAPTWDPVDQPYDAVTLDLSHTAVSGADALSMAECLGDRLKHLHLADGTGSPRDEHLVPGRGSQPCVEVLELLAARSFTGTVVVEINTRRVVDPAEREADLTAALAFARLNLVAPADAAP
jgi:sugar phosphate isomerase/epimerase